MQALYHCIIAASAQAPPAGAEPDSAAVQSVWDFVVKGGPMMVPLGVCSLLALAVIVERLFSLRRSQVLPADFLGGLKDTLKDNPANYDRALAYCRQHPCPIAQVLMAGLKHFSKTTEVIEKHVEEAGQRVVTRLRKYLRFLSVVAAIAPLMGLLGTILGMIKAFQTVSVSAGALGKTEQMATGIYEALITTAAGLLIAIPVLIAYHFLSARIEGLVLDMDQKTVEFLEEHGPASMRPSTQQAHIAA